MYRQWIKRLLDLTVATVLSVLLCPVLLVTALLVRIFLGSPVLFVQARPGLFEKKFYLYKFRTMKNIRDTNGMLLSDGQRLTRFGRLLRSLSLDELPTLFNVIKGDMSLTGPRPLLMEYLPWYSPEQRKRHGVRPGITGWAQVNGRNTLEWTKKFKLDVWYVEHYSFWLDCRILCLTLVKTLKREGIHAVGEATMTRFDQESAKQGSPPTP